MLLSFPEKLWMIFVRSDLSIKILMSGNLFPVPISLLFFANSTAYTHAYFFFQAPAAMALKLHCNKDFPWTERERKYKMIKMKQQNAASNTHFIRSVLRVGWSLTGEDRGDGLAAEDVTAMSVLLSQGWWHPRWHWEPTLLLTPFHRICPHSYIPLFISSSKSEQTLFNLLLLFPAFLKPLPLPGLPQCTPHKLSIGQFLLVTAWVWKGRL